MSAERHLKTVRTALLRGKCLRAGTAIDRVYVALGRKPNASVRRRLKKLDHFFEHHCVRKRPTRKFKGYAP